MHYNVAYTWRSQSARTPRAGLKRDCTVATYLRLGFPCRKSSALSRVLPQDQQSSNDVYLRRRYMTGRVEQCNYVSSTRYRRVVVWAGNNVCLPPLTLPVPSGSVAYKPDLPDVERLMGNL
ncbi:hypothetical protein HYQ44_017245 [Verticillium longisporum]|nr:hypothetical protein HYQ44_017245 [Verticillium longisporum]